MAKIRVKICGLTTPEQARIVASSGADAVGLVFYDASPRAVSIEQARAIAYAAGPFTTVVGLFVNATTEFIHQVLAQVPLHTLQFHGAESPAFCQQFNRPYIKAIRMKPEMDIAAEMARYPEATGLLLDAYRSGVPGGTGERFDWTQFPQRSGQSFILAGGLTPANVAEAIAATGCMAVDVSGGVEAAPGVKDATKIRDFIFNTHLSPDIK